MRHRLRRAAAAPAPRDGTLLAALLSLALPATAFAGTRHAFRTPRLAERSSVFAAPARRLEARERGQTAARAVDLRATATGARFAPGPVDELLETPTELAARLNAQAEGRVEAGGADAEYDQAEPSRSVTAVRTEAAPGASNKWRPAPRGGALLAAPPPAAGGGERFTYRLTKWGGAAAGALLAAPPAFAGLPEGGEQVARELFSWAWYLAGEAWEHPLFTMAAFSMLSSVGGAAWSLARRAQHAYELHRFSRLMPHEQSEMLSSPGARHRLLALDFYREKGRVGEIASRLATMALNDPSRKVRIGALEAVGESKSSSAAGWLGKIAGDKQKDLEERKAALGAVAALGGSNAAQALLRIHEDAEEDEELRVAAADALSGIADPAAVPGLVKTLAAEMKEPGDLAQATVFALLDIGTPESFKPLAARIEQEAVEWITTGDGDETTVIDWLHAEYERIIAEEEKPAPKRFERIAALFAQVAHGNGRRLLDTVLKMSADDESTEDFGEAMDALAIPEETSDWLYGLSAADFRSTFGKFFAGKQELLQEAADDSDERLRNLLAVDVSPEKIKELGPELSEE